MKKFPDVDPEFHRQIFTATDKIQRLVKSPADFTQSEFSSVLNEICGALTQSMQRDIESIFFAAADAAADPHDRSEALAVIRDAKTFTQFLEFEKNSLIACGLSDAMARSIINDIKKLRERLNNDITFDPRKTLAAINRCRDDLCIASQGASEILQGKERKYWLKRRGAVAGGVCLGIANAAAITYTAGMAAPFVVLSTASAAALVSAQGLIEEPGKKKHK